MKCLSCLFYYSPDAIKVVFTKPYATAMLDIIEEQGFDGFCKKHNVFVRVDCVCSGHLPASEVE